LGVEISAKTQQRKNAKSEKFRQKVLKSSIVLVKSGAVLGWF
jgi:hypothetical protein